MLLVVGAVEERDSSVTGLRQKGLPGVFVLLQFGCLAVPELLPFGRVVSEPVTEFIAGGNVLDPPIHPQAFFLHSSRPESFHEKSFAITSLHGFVDALDS